MIAPPWSNLPETHDRIVIRIEPGMAFGTGTHETTRLCLQAIEKHFAGGSFLDVGTGTGILAIAAAKLFPESRIDACDTDEMAITIARENADANGVSNQIDFRVGSIDDSTASADLVCANLTADVISSPRANARGSDLWEVDTFRHPGNTNRDGPGSFSRIAESRMLKLRRMASGWR